MAKQEQVEKQPTRDESETVDAEEQEAETIRQTVRPDIANTWWPKN